MLLTGTAEAQQVLRYHDGVGYVLESPNNADYSYLHNAGQDSFAKLGQALGQDLTRAIRKPQAVALILTVKCDKYVEATFVYDNNTSKVTSFDPTPASDSNLNAIRAAFPALRVAALDAGC